MVRESSPDATATRVSPQQRNVTALRVGTAFVFAVSLALLASHVDATRRGFDDAYITYQYASNLAHGRGFVFNAGDQPSLGTSTPLYTLLLALGGRLGLDIPFFSTAVGILATSVALSLLVCIGWEIGFFSAGLAAAILASVAQPYWAWEGMETSFYLAIILGAFWTTLRGWGWLGFSLAALATITRLDGLAVLVAVGVFLMVRRTCSWRSFLPGAALMAAWLVAATLLFGSPLPTSGLAKMNHPSAVSGRFDVLSLVLVRQTLPTTLLISDPVFWNHPRRATALSLFLLSTPLVCLALVGKVRLPIVLLATWLALYLGGYELLRLPEFSWYYGPPAVVLALFFWMTLHAIARMSADAVHWRGERLGRLTVWVVAAVMLGALIVGTPLRERVRVRPHVQAGRWLGQHAAAGDTVVAYEVGTIAYLSGLRTVDLLGLTEPAVRSRLRSGDFSWAIRDRPVYVFSTEIGNGIWPVTRAIFNECVFALNYRPVVRLPFRDDTDYVIYQRASPDEPSSGRSDAEWIDVYHPPSMRRAITVGYSLTFRNRSPHPWHASSSDAPVVTYGWSDSSGNYLAAHAIRTPIPCDVGPGQRVLVSAAVRAPEQPGTYALTWKLDRADGGSLSQYGSASMAGSVMVY